MDDYTSVLFARPSFAEGIGRLLDFAGTLTEYNRALTGQQADEAAFRADTLALGADMRTALGQLDDVKARDRQVEAS
jgi:hypothetical protein